MKRAPLACLALIVSGMAAFGQAAHVGTLVEPQPAQKALEQKPAPLTAPKPVDALLGKSVFHQGYFMDLVRAQQKLALFDLRTPVDPDLDLENLIFSHDTDKIQGIVLFRWKF